jgi:hypothetical protein
VDVLFFVYRNQQLFHHGLGLLQSLVVRSHYVDVQGLVVVGLGPSEMIQTKSDDKVMRKKQMLVNTGNCSFFYKKQGLG